MGTRWDFARLADRDGRLACSDCGESIDLYDAQAVPLYRQGHFIDMRPVCMGCLEHHDDRLRAELRLAPRKRPDGGQAYTVTPV